MDKVVILGAGSMGTALAVHLSNKGCQISLWGRNKTKLVSLSTSLENKEYLPDIKLSNSIDYISDLKVCRNANYIVLAVPTTAFLEMLIKLKEHLNEKTSLVITCKGLEPNSAMYLSEVAKKYLPGVATIFLQGPSFALELANGDHGSFTLCSEQIGIAKDFGKLISNDSIVVEYTDDVIGVQLAGFLKNIFAILLGMAEGIGLKSNAKATLFICCIREMNALISAFGKKETVNSFAALGDIILTASDNKSRNRRLGYYLGQGFNIEQAKERIGQVTEGLVSLSLVSKFVSKKNFKLFICETLFEVVYNNMEPKKAITSILQTTRLER